MAAISKDATLDSWQLVWRAMTPTARISSLSELVPAGVDVRLGHKVEPDSPIHEKDVAAARACRNQTLPHTPIADP